MRFWVIYTGEPAPTDDGNLRLMRTGTLTQFLAERGHDVTWWNGKFDHRMKTMRTAPELCRIDNGGSPYTQRLIPSPGYKKNLSFRRIWAQKVAAKKFASLAAKCQMPDLILCGYPTVELSLASVALGKRWGIPVVLEVRDLWPDTFLDFVPRPLRWAARLSLTGMFRDSRRSFAGAAGITGNTSEMVKWGLERSGRDWGSWDQDFPLGSAAKPPTQEQQAQAREFWARKGVAPQEKVLYGCFFGVFSKRREVDVLIQAARILEQKGVPFKFVLCGRGVNYDKCLQLSSGCSNVIMVDWISWPKIYTLMEMSSVGFAPYESSPDFMASIPNKPYDYMSAGLVIVSSLQGKLKELLDQEGCGVTYPNKDVDALVKILGDLYQNPEQVKIMSQKSLRLFNDKFSADTVFGGMCDYLEKIVAEHSRK
ncbi:MAG: glycosyltransferase family 4 protein [Proteobacteria bacterium]|nr:glycosyltransferase family 4 protein [Pseudomonadota bacterium]MBU4384653.1 glycosyltransferase family 4 protein [Pseudomonadota bacterium]MCG2766199.1 glycosyltransferase family 4 protein [Desulfarculaceae bacterium]